MKIGDRGILINIHRDSASYELRDSYVGRQVEIVSIGYRYRDNWIGAKMKFLDNGEKVYISPALVAETWKQDNKRKEDKRTTTPYGNLYRRKLRLERKKP